MTLRIGLIAAALIAVCACAPAEDAAPIETREFDVLVDDRYVGAHSLKIKQLGERTVVALKSDIEVRILLFRYVYAFDAKETWDGDALVAVDARTNDNGSKTRLQLKRNAERSVVQFKNQISHIEPPHQTTCYSRLPPGVKNSQVKHSQTVRLLNIDDGDLVTTTWTGVEDVKLQIDGDSIACRKWVVRGGLSAELWFDDSGWLVRQRTVERGHPTELRLTSIQRESAAVNRGLWLAGLAWLAASPVEAMDGTFVTPEIEVPPLADSGWWNDPQVQELIELANPFGTPPIERETRYVDPYGWQFIQDPYRLGFTKHDEIVFLPASDVRGGAPGATGTMQVTEFYSWLRYSYLARPDVLVNLTGIFDGYYWAGPGQPSLPGQVDRLSVDMEAVLLGHGPINTTFGFTPQLVTDPEQKITRYAFNFDSRVINTQRLSPDWLLVYGVAVWNRVDLFIIPEVGVIWTPDDRWEFRLLFPRSQFSYRLGQIYGGQTWITSVVEYTAQAYEVGIEDQGRIDRIQLRDWRASLGVRQDYYRISWTADVGFVFDRHVSFLGPTPDYNLAPTAIARFGFWF